MGGSVVVVAVAGSSSSSTGGSVVVAGSSSSSSGGRTVPVPKPGIMTWSFLIILLVVVSSCRAGEGCMLWLLLLLFLVVMSQGVSPGSMLLVPVVVGAMAGGGARVSWPVASLLQPALAATVTVQQLIHNNKRASRIGLLDMDRPVLRCEEDCRGMVVCCL